jgi:uncharacterized RDD family membrane protein YckC
VTMDPSQPRDPNAPAPPDAGATPPPEAPPPAAPPPAAPPQQSWQSQPQQPAPPPPGGGQPPAGAGSQWMSNITTSGTIAGPAGTALADIPNRLIAILIDGILLGIVGAIVNAIITPILGERLFGGLLGFEVVVPSLLSSIVVVAIVAAVSAGYFIYMWTRMDGATVGMRVLKLRLADASSGGPVSQQQAINRWLMLGLPIALSQFFYWGVIGLLVSLAVLGWYIYLLMTTAQSPTRQGYHDKYAGTVVTKLAA